MDRSHLMPVVADRGDVVLHEETTSNAGIGLAIERLAAHLDQGEHFDDISLRIDHIQNKEGSRVCFSYRGVRRR